MLSNEIWRRGETLLNEASHGALSAAAAVFVLWLAAKCPPLHPALRRVAAGGAVIAALLTGLGVAFGSAVFRPAGRFDRLAGVASILFVAGGLASGTRPLPVRLAVLGAGAAGAGWWLDGAPMKLPNDAAAWVIAIGVVAIGAAVALAVALAERMPGPWSTLAPGFVLWACLHLAGAPHGVSESALIVFVAGFGLLVRPRGRNTGIWPYAGLLAATGLAAVLGFGGLPHRGVNRIDLAAIAPLLAFGLAAWLASRGWRDRSAGFVASLIALLLVWTAGDLTR
jgi:hypothetical protein